EITQDATVILLPLQRVGIHAHDARMGEEFCEGLLHFLRAQAGVADLRIPALLVRAGGRNRLGMAANMALEFLFLAMVGERDAAVGALRHVTAEGALERAGIAAPVQEENGLLAAFEPLRDGFLELGREDRNGPAFAHGL